METLSALEALCQGNPPVSGGFPSQRPVTHFDVFFNLRINKRLSKQSGRRWFETPSRLLWLHCDIYTVCKSVLLSLSPQPLSRKTHAYVNASFYILIDTVWINIRFYHTSLRTNKCQMKNDRNSKMEPAPWVNDLKFTSVDQIAPLHIYWRYF